MYIFYVMKKIAYILGITAIAVVLLILLQGVFSDNEAAPEPVNEPSTTELPVTEPPVVKETPVFDEDEESEKMVIESPIPDGWQTYVNTGHGFSISYPAEWIFIRDVGEYVNDDHYDSLSRFIDTKIISYIKFGPDGVFDFGSNFKTSFPKPWSVFITDSTDFENKRYVELLQEDSIEQYGVNERTLFDPPIHSFKVNEDRSFGVIDGQKSLIINETIDESEGMPYWKSTRIFIEKDEKLYVISDLSNTDDVYETYEIKMSPEEFQKFYESFQFLE
jgi:hypothetical protein